MALFAGFLVCLLAVLGVRHHATEQSLALARGNRRVAIVEMNLLATAVLERDRAVLKPRFQVTDFQVRDFYDRHPDRFSPGGTLKPFAAVREAAVELATAERHDEVMRAYLAAAKEKVGFKEGTGGLARIGSQVVEEADFEAYLDWALDEHQKAQYELTPGARELYLGRFLEYEVLAAKARAEGIR